MNEVKQETWEDLAGTAKHTLDALIARLPDELRPEALRIGYQLQKRCDDGDGSWGVYRRFTQVITLYLESIREDCFELSRDFCTEVERTYLHEFGHHLGLDERGVERYGL